MQGRKNGGSCLPTLHLDLRLAHVDVAAPDDHGILLLGVDEASKVGLGQGKGGSGAQHKVRRGKRLPPGIDLQEGVLGDEEQRGERPGRIVLAGHGEAGIKGKVPLRVVDLLDPQKKAVRVCFSTARRPQDEVRYELMDILL